MHSKFGSQLFSLLVLGLGAAGFYAYAKKTDFQQDQLACLNIDHQRVQNQVEDDLLNHANPAFFGTFQVQIGSLYIHPTSLNATSTHIVVPFSLENNGKTTEFEAKVRCSDLRDIGYSRI